MTMEESMNAVYYATRYFGFATIVAGAYLMFATQLQVFPYALGVLGGVAFGYTSGWERGRP